MLTLPLPWPFELEQAALPGFSVVRNWRSGDWSLYSHRARAYVMAGNSLPAGPDAAERLARPWAYRNHPPEKWASPDTRDLAEALAITKEVPNV